MFYEKRKPYNMKSIIKEAFRIVYFFAPIILFFVLSTMTLTRDDNHVKSQTKKQIEYPNEQNISVKRVAILINNGSQILTK